MRIMLRLAAVLFVTFAVAAPSSYAAAGNCEFVVCGAKCVVYGEFAGYCNPITEHTTGCVQLYGPDCASLENAYCCQQNAGAF